MNNIPDISVVMSVYNAEEYLKESIDSILGQTYKNFEFIIINDGSTDRSAKIINSFTDKRIIVINQENSGLPAALNKGITIALGRYIARMDADDIANLTRFEKQFLFLEHNPEVVVVGTWADIISKEGEYLYTENKPTDSKSLKDSLPTSPFFHGSVMIRTSSLMEVEGYKSVFKNRQDVVLWIDLSEKGKFTNIEEALYKFRLTPDSNQRKSKKYIKLQDEVISKYFNTRFIDRDLLSKMDFRTGGLSKRHKLSLYYLIVGKVYIERRFERQFAFTYLLRSLMYRPSNFVALFNMFLLFLPKRMVMRWKDFRLKRIDGLI